MRKNLQLLLALGLALTTGAANASLLSADWLRSGDSLLTRDTATKLDWLDLTETYNQTVAQVLPLTGAGQRYQGFRPAGAGEVNTLMIDARLPITGVQTIVSDKAADLAAADALTVLLGETLQREFGDGFYGSRGHLLDEGVGRVIGYYVTTLPFYFEPPYTEAGLFTPPGLYSDNFLESACTIENGCTTTGSGVWLVRSTPIHTVPEPAALGLLGIGLAGLVGARRSRGGVSAVNRV